MVDSDSMPLMKTTQQWDALLREEEELSDPPTEGPPGGAMGNASMSLATAREEVDRVDDISVPAAPREEAPRAHPGHPPGGGGQSTIETKQSEEGGQKKEKGPNRGEAGSEVRA